MADPAAMRVSPSVARCALAAPRRLLGRPGSGAICPPIPARPAPRALTGSAHWRPASASPASFACHGALPFGGTGARSPIPGPQRLAGGTLPRSPAAGLPVQGMGGSWGVGGGRPRSGTATEAAAKKAEGFPIQDEGRAYWEAVAKAVKKSSARGMVEDLTRHDVVGVDVSLPGVRTNSGKEEKDIRGRSIYDWIAHVKKKHPTKVVLVRVGEFYETMGWDAVAMVEYAGLNRMGGAGRPPKAGCPIVNLGHTIRSLLNAGFSVVVLEEMQQGGASKISTDKRKERYVAGVVTAASPEYIHNRVDGATTDYTVAPPVLVVSAGARGVTVAEICPDMRTCAVREALTEEAAVSKIDAGYAELYVHDSVYSKDLKEQTKVLRHAVRGRQKKNAWGTPAHQMALQGIEEDLEWGGVQWTTTVASDEGRPQPLHVATARQLGVMPAPGVPCLVDRLLPPRSPALCTKFLRDLLLSPPPYRVGAAIQDATRRFAALEEPLPEFLCEHPAKYTRLIMAREANDAVFLELSVIAGQVMDSLGASPPGGGGAAGGLRGAAEAVLAPVSFLTGLHVEGGALLHSMHALRGEVARVVNDAPRGNNAWGEDSITRTSVPALEKLFAELESEFRGRVRSGCGEEVRAAYRQVAEAAEALEAAVGRVDDLIRSSLHMPTAKNRPPELQYDYNSKAVWLKATPADLKNIFSGILIKEGSGLTLEDFFHPRDKNGRVSEKHYSTHAIEDARRRYMQAVDAAHDAVVAELRGLAARLEPDLAHIVAGVTFCTVARALDLHAREAARRHWALPSVAWNAPPPPRPSVSPDATGAAGSAAAGEGLDVEGAVASPAEGSGSGGLALEVEGLWPYWMEEWDAVTVPNSFRMEGMYLLTGPNMAGKSTVQRATCAAVLLGLCGLTVPARAASIPRVDMVMLRMGAADSPAEGHSSFMVEMLDALSILRSASGSSLVMVDELGKGTEPDEGAAIAAAVLAALDARGCKGIFATHLYSILDLPMDLPGTARMAMQTEEAEGGGGVKPTWRIVAGECRKSLALDVASQVGLPEGVLRDARDFLAHLQARKPSAQPPPADAGPPAAPEEWAGEDGEDGSSPAPPPVSSEELEEVLRGTAWAVCGRAGELSGVVRDGALPPPRLVGRSAVYILMEPSGRLYCGESDDLTGRIKRHRSDWKRAKPGMPGLEFVYIEVEEKSGARKLESAVTVQLEREGHVLRSVHDAKHRHFSAAPSPAPGPGQSPAAGA